MTTFKPESKQLLILRWFVDRTSRSEQGVTLLECLVAIMVIAVTIAAITPPIFVAVATRVQNQRAEQAQQLAQQEIDRTRLVVERGVYTVADLPPDLGVANVATAPPPSSAATILNDRTQATSATRAYTVDVNRDGKEDFLVQIFRNPGVNGVTNNPPPVAFAMGVRVYAAQARPRLGSLSAEPAALKFVTGQGQQISRPLAVLYTQISRSDSRNSLGHQCRLLGGTNCPVP